MEVSKGKFNLTTIIMIPYSISYKGRQKAIRRDEAKGEDKLLKLDSIVEIPSEDDTLRGN